MKKIFRNSFYEFILLAVIFLEEIIRVRLSSFKSILELNAIWNRGKFKKVFSRFRTFVVLNRWIENSTGLPRL